MSTFKCLRRIDNLTDPSPESFGAENNQSPFNLCDIWVRSNGFMEAGRAKQEFKYCMVDSELSFLNIVYSLPIVKLGSL